jgi:drug/metabolite transporter (DMT)-like permease
VISKFRADLGLLSVTFFWGTTFILSKQVLVDVPLPVFLFLRLTIAAVAINIYTLKYRAEWNKQVFIHGGVLGVLLYLSYFFQMWGIQFTTASNAGFITGLSVVLVPIFGFLFFKFRPAPNVLFGIVFAVAGLLLLTGANPLDWNNGDLLVLICTVSVAFHVIFTGRFAPKNNVYLLTATQLTVVSFLTMFALPFSEFQWPAISSKQWWVLIYLGLFGTVFTFLMQTAMQRFTTTARTALIFAMEPVFAAIFAYLIASESLSLTGWIGGLLIVLGMIAAELEFGKWAIFNKRKDK